MRIVQSVILFLQDQVLGMQWLKDMFAAFLQAIGVDIQSRLGASLHFFFYDVVKITLLLCLLIFLISYIQSYFPPEKSRSIAARYHGIKANLISALLGTVKMCIRDSAMPADQLPLVPHDLAFSATACLLKFDDYDFSLTAYTPHPAMTLLHLSLIHI